MLRFAFKHIVIDGRFFRRSTGGIGRYTQALVRELMSQESPDRYTLLLRPEDRGDWSQFMAGRSLDSEQWQVSYVNIPHYSFAEQTKLMSVLKKLQPDLVHFTNFNHPILWQRPFVTTIHDLTILKYPVGKSQTSLVSKWAFRRVLHHAAFAAKKIMTVSETSKSDLVDYLHVAPEKITVTYEGVDDVFQPVNLPLRGRAQGKIAKKLGLRPPYLLFVSQWRPHKGLPILIAAYEEVRNRNPRLKPQLVIIGQPNPNYPEILAAIERSPYRADIIRPGFIAESDLIALYQTAEAFVFPSLYEGFGLPPLEAMASGTPVIASDASCLPEILGTAAELVPHGNVAALARAIEQVITDRSLWRQLRSTGLAHARNFSWAKMARQTSEVYGSILKAS